MENKIFLFYFLFITDTRRMAKSSINTNRSSFNGLRNRLTRYLTLDNLANKPDTGAVFTGDKQSSVLLMLASCNQFESGGKYSKLHKYTV